jgi:hypothetical protein
LATDIYLVETIKNRRMNPYTNSFEYEIKWEGWGNSYNTWESMKNLHHLQDLVDDFNIRKNAE